MTFEARVLTITVAQPVGMVSAYLADPRTYPDWASGLAGGLTSLAGQSSEDADPHLWSTRTPEGEVTIRFTPANDFGVADHWVFLPNGSTVYVPLRAVANGSGAEVCFTLFRLPSMSAEQFEQDAAWVLRDLQALKAALESGGACSDRPEAGPNSSRPVGDRFLTAGWAEAYTEPHG